MRSVALAAVCCLLAGCASSQATKAAAKDSNSLPLGNFSVSLTVKDLAASRAFYEKLGFHAVGGNQAQNWLIMQNETATIGLFHGMFDKNTLTFNPGWNRDSQPLASFEDVRALQKELESRGVAIAVKADPASDGPAFFLAIDPDGNPVLVDQHTPRPK